MRLNTFCCENEANDTREVNSSLACQRAQNVGGDGVGVYHCRCRCLCVSATSNVYPANGGRLSASLYVQEIQALARVSMSLACVSPH